MTSGKDIQYPASAIQHPALVQSFHPHYPRVWYTFFRNSLVREMTFRGNFVITVVTRAFWFCAQLLLLHGDRDVDQRYRGDAVHAELREL